jgi:hypothetical protein
MITQKSEQQKEVVIQIKGQAAYSDKSESDQVAALDSFVLLLFKKYQETLHREFEAAGELSYIIADEKSDEMIDPYLKNFSFDTVTSDVR